MGVEDTCSGAVLYTVKPYTRAALLEVYRKIYPDRPLPDISLEITMMSESCPDCLYRLRIGDTDYCIRAQPGQQVLSER